VAIRRLVGSALGVTALLSGVTAASAKAPGTTSAKVVGTVKIDAADPTVAYVLAQYRCTIADPLNHPGHLWVSVKQNDAGTVDSAVSGEGSGFFTGAATRWEDSHRNDITCDGKNHTERFTVDQVEGKSRFGTLVKGDAWVQFCLFDDTTPQGDGESDFGQPVSSMVWTHVH
jgi:hypothetical protein